jgi:hypothetical protein
MTSDEDSQRSLSEAAAHGIASQLLSIGSVGSVIRRVRRTQSTEANNRAIV